MTQQGTCKDCKYWDSPYRQCSVTHTEEYAESAWGWGEHEEDIEPINCGPDFGCVHYTPKEGEENEVTK